MKKLFLSGVMLLWTCTLLYSGEGQTSAIFLRISPSARSSALGNSMTSFKESPESVWINPAGIAGLSGRLLSASYSDLLGIAKSGWANLVLGTPVYSYSAGLYYFAVDSIEKRDNDSAVPQGTINYSNMVLYLSYARPLSSSLGFGVNLKTLYSRLDDISASTFAFDLGLIHSMKILNQDINLGLSAQNLGLKLRGYSLPALIRAGGSIHFFEKKLTLALDEEIPISGAPVFHTGIEGHILKHFSLRAGYEPQGLSFGFAVRFFPGPEPGWVEAQGEKTERFFQLDYAIVQARELGENHRVSITTGF